MSPRFRITRWFKRCCVVFCLMAMVLVVGVLVLAAGAGGSTSGRLASGRSVTAHSDAWSLQTKFSADIATIDTAGYKIVVAPQELKVDGKPIVTIDPTVNAVSVNVQDGTVTFLVNGKSVGTYTR